MKTFSKSFTQQESIPQAAIDQAVTILKSGRLHRYNVAEGETSETSLLEQEYAAYQGAKYCLACASGGYAMHIALRAFGLQQGDKVLTNAFTLSPVPGAIHNAGGKPVLVETTEDLVADLTDLERKIKQSSARVMLLSHMRGHIVDMDALCALLDKHNVALIEDCAHTMGASWNGHKSGNFGVAACFSTQTYKHINSGEGGFITTDDKELIARAIIHSGSYMLYDRHDAAPGAEFFDQIRLENPNYSGRMDNLRAAILRPQLNVLDDNCRRWNERYQTIESVLAATTGLRVIQRYEKEYYVGSSIQFLVNDIGNAEIPALVNKCLERGVEIKWFGTTQPTGYTSRHDSWRYVEPQSLPVSDRILSMLCDLRIPLTFTVEDCRLIGEIISECATELHELGDSSAAIAQAS